MNRCLECEIIEGDFHYTEDDEQEEVPVCDECGAENSMSFFNEDQGADR